MSKQEVADYLLERLRAWDVEHVFAFPGDGINGILAAFGRADNQPKFIQARHEEMSAFEAVGYAKFTGRVGVCMATSGPGAMHLLNGLYDAKLDHVPVVAIVGQTNRSAMGGSYQQEIDLISLFKDVASDYVQMVTVPEQLPNVLDRAIRVALTQRAPTALIIPSDVQELPYSPPTHAFKMVPSSLGIEWPAIAPDDAAIARAAADPQRRQEGRHAGRQRRARAREELVEVAELLGAGAAKALLGKDVLSDELPWVTGSIGLLGTRPSYEMMRDCDTLLTVGSSFPYTQFLPEFGQCRAVQIDVDGRMIGMRYPYEINLVADAKSALRALIPLLRRKEDRSWREHIEKNVARWWETMDMEAMVSDRARSIRCGCSPSCHRNCPKTPSWQPIPAHRPTGTREICGSAATFGARCRATWPPWAPAFRTPSARNSPTRNRPVIAFVGDGAMQMNGMAELITDQTLLAGVGRSAPDRGRPAQQRPQPGDLGDARDGRRAEFAESQTLPDVDFAGFAASLGSTRRPSRIPRSSRTPGATRCRPTGPPCWTSTPIPTCLRSRRTPPGTSSRRRPPPCWPATRTGWGSSRPA